MEDSGHGEDGSPQQQQQQQQPGPGQQQRLQYSIPGILHFIQHEWARFEMERSQWEVERAELQARIAFLQGERKGQENLKNDLVRRIKMLEYALKQERAKYHKLKYGTELNQGDMKPPSLDEGLDDREDSDSLLITSSNAGWRQGRQILRQYLQEVGYTDTIIDIRSSRVRSLLGLGPPNADDSANQPPTINGEVTAGKRASETQGRRTPAKKIIPTSLAEGTLMDSEAAVLETFDFLVSQGDMDEEEDNLSDEMEEGSADEDNDERLEMKRIKPKGKLMIPVPVMDMGDAETEEVLSEFDFLGPESGEGGGEARSQADSQDWRPSRFHLQAMLASLGEQGDTFGSLSDYGMQGGGNKLPVFTAGARRPLITVPGTGISDEDPLEAALGLGELAAITVSNDAESNYDVAANKESFRKTWTAKYTLRSHFDGVRALAFHPAEPVLITASEDHTLKLWNLQKTVPAKKTASLDVEPVYTFRGHIGDVLCLAISKTGNECYSGGLDSTIKCWNIPNSNVDPYDSFDASILNASLTSHSDAVWGLATHPTKPHLLSCSSDATVRLWSPSAKVPLVQTFAVEADGIPTSVDFVVSDTNQFVAGFTTSKSIIYDIETGKATLRFETDSVQDSNPSLSQVNRVISHPTLPVTITAHEDRHIRFYDNSTGKLIHSMVAHLDAVTCLAIDPNGLYLLSGSHDCSIRLWNLDNKTCVQEITSHRKKFDESIFDVAFHPSKPFIASAGADALAKVFV